jgi:hypothetical protein
MALIISSDDAKDYYSEFLFKNGTKGATFENVQIILKSKHVEIRDKPLDVEEAKEWKSEKNKLVHNFDRIIQGKNKKKKEGNTSKTTCFFDSTKYQTLTKICSSPDHSVSNETTPVQNDSLSISGK